MSTLHKDMSRLRDSLMRVIAIAVAEGLSPLGALTVSLASIEEQACAILRDAALKERLRPSDEGESVVDDYYILVQEQLHMMQMHMTELYRMAKNQAAMQAKPDVAGREVAELQRLFDNLDTRSRKPS